MNSIFIHKRSPFVFAVLHLSQLGKRVKGLKNPKASLKADPTKMLKQKREYIMLRLNLPTYNRDNHNPHTESTRPKIISLPMGSEFWLYIS